MTSFLFVSVYCFDLLRCRKAPLLPLFAQGLFGGRIFSAPPANCKIQPTRSTVVDTLRLTFVKLINEEATP